MGDGFDIDLSDFNKLSVDLAKTGGAVGALTAVVTKKSAADIERDGKIFCPVDTGNLQNSISTTITGDGRMAGMSAEIGPTASYGGWVEWGTSRKGPAAYMGPAFDRHAGAFEAALGKITETTL